MRGSVRHQLWVEAEASAGRAFGGDVQRRFVLVNGEEERYELRSLGRVDGEDLREGRLVMALEERIVEQLFQRAGIASTEVRGADLHAEQRRRIESAAGVAIALRDRRHVVSDFEHADFGRSDAEGSDGPEDALNLFGARRSTKTHARIRHCIGRWASPARWSKYCKLSILAVPLRSYRLFEGILIGCGIHHAQA